MVLYLLVPSPRERALGLPSVSSCGGGWPLVAHRPWDHPYPLRATLSLSGESWLSGEPLERKIMCCWEEPERSAVQGFWVLPSQVQGLAPLPVSRVIWAKLLTSLCFGFLVCKVEQQQNRSRAVVKMRWAIRGQVYQQGPAYKGHAVVGLSLILLLLLVRPGPPLLCPGGPV